MSEILTESFCERCGTRYTFESARPKNRLKGVKVLSRGLKNFVLSDDTTMDEAMAAARSESDREATAYQLDAFHKTFNFCMSCRQYTCPNCWNEVEARCQSCAPLPEQEPAAPEVVPPAFPGLVTLAGPGAVAEATSNGTNGHDYAAGTVDEAAAIEPEDVAAAPETIADATEVAPPAVDALTASPAPQTVDDPFAKATDQTAGLFSRFRPGQNLDDALAAFERERTTAEPAPEPVEAVEAEPFEAAGVQPVEAAAAQLVESAPAEEVVPAASEPAPEADTGAPIEVGAAAVDELDLAAAEALTEIEPEPVAAEAGPEPSTPATADVVEQPTWRITAPDLDAPSISAPTRPDDAAPRPATGPTIPAAEPQWPAKPEWPTPQASAGLPFLGRPAQPQGGIDTLWAASNRELVATPPAPGRATSGIQPCISCGLSLSANARFCRRCGTLQGGG